MSIEQEARILARDRVAARVEKMLDYLHAKDKAVLDRLRSDAVGEIKRWKSVTLKSLDRVPVTDCNIAAVYLPDADPPEIGILESVSKRRASFSALHEYGHHLQGLDELDLVDELGAQVDLGRALEELTSDAFAAKVLIPDEVVSMYLGASTPTALQVASLFKNGTASRAAVCVAAIQQFESPGHVLLIDESGIVDFSTSHLLPPLRRGLTQSASAVMKTWRISDRGSVEERSRFTYRDGIKGEELYAQATDIDGYTVVVAVVDKAPWRALSLSSTEERVVAVWHTCESCDHVFQAWTRCENCGRPRCPECEWCDCKTLPKEKMCTGCLYLKSIHLFDAGQEQCRDCAS